MPTYAEQPMARVLIAEDEANIASFVEKGLAEHGHTSSVASDGEDAARMATSTDFDLLILDLGLPTIDGFEVLRRLRGRGDRLPVIVLTAVDDVSTTVEALDLGANDYLTKPFAFDELLARVRVRLRESGTNPMAGTTILESSGVRLDLRTHQATVDGREVALSAKEFQLAHVLVEHAGQVMSKTQLLNRVWGYDFEGGSTVVEVYVNYLRKKLGRQRIETVRGVGYRLR
jgi:DNA-binding response OmpR family regulator